MFTERISSLAETTQSDHQMSTLPDLLAPKLDLLFVGINPSLYSVQQGHYFARSQNRFWPAFSRSLLSQPIRIALGREQLTPGDDHLLPRFGVGFTDVVKRPTASAAQLTSSDYRAGIPILLDKLTQTAPRIVCFHGMTGYRRVARNAFGRQERPAELGVQPERLGESTIFVVPNPSPANAHYSLDDLVAWYDRLHEQLLAVDPA